MNKFWSDYKEVCDVTKSFYKNHWKGTLMLNVAIIGVMAGVTYVNLNKDAIKAKFTKKKS